MVEDAFLVIQHYLGSDRLLQAVVIEPDDAFFPDPYDPSPDAATRLFARVCGYMQVNPESVILEFWQSEHSPRDFHRAGIINGPTQTSGAAGLYTKADGFDKVKLNLNALGDPVALVSTIAHELAHVVLLGRRGLSHDVPHMEAITDLATIYLGFGIFTSNTLLRRRGWTEGNIEGWEVSRKGYISPEMAGWALSLFAWARGEKRPEWARHLSTDPKEYLKVGLRYLEETRDTRFALDVGASHP